MPAGVSGGGLNASPERPMEKKPMLTWEQRYEMIVTRAWEVWTKNGAGLDDDDRSQTTNSAQDAATNAYVDDISDADWLAATLRALGA